MKIYIGGSFAARQRIQNEAKYLIDSGHVVLSRWYNEDDAIEKIWDQNFGGRAAEAMAMGDAYDILEADIVIIDTIEKSTSGGRDTELGMALMRSLVGRPLRVIHIGPYGNIFQNLAREHYGSWAEMLEESGL